MRESRVVPDAYATLHSLSSEETRRASCTWNPLPACAACALCWQLPWALSAGAPGRDGCALFQTCWPRARDDHDVQKGREAKQSRRAPQRAGRRPTVGPKAALARRAKCFSMIADMTASTVHPPQTRPIVARVEADIRKARKAFFFEKKEAKNFCSYARATVRPGSASVCACISVRPQGLTLDAQQESKACFFEKTAKNFYPCCRDGSAARTQGNKSFLVLFFKKEPLGLAM